MRVSIIPVSIIPLESEALLLVNHKMVPVTMSMKPAKSGEAKRPEKVSSKKIPISAAGTDPTMIKRTNLPWVEPQRAEARPPVPWFPLKTAIIPFGISLISLQKTMTIAMRVPT